ncbi:MULTISPECIES: PAS domain-containing protein [Streptomyces]|uniref:PAS domain-containing protein n=1 Tax=Streptomyces TaxID=1883 RepID=UPI0004CBED47|nr:MULTISPECIES: PAS domain-containing protein [Streptomyces]RPK78684.1 PAS fold protein [Streptomyces sp. ADI98-10]
MIDMRDAIPLDGDAGDLPDPTMSATAVVDARGVVTGWSEGAERLLGYPSRAAIGRPAARLLGTDRDTGGAVRAVLGGRSVTAALRHRDGRRVAVRLRTFPWSDRSGTGGVCYVYWPTWPTPSQQRVLRSLGLV